MLGLTYLLNSIRAPILFLLDWGSYIISIATLSFVGASPLLHYLYFYCYYVVEALIRSMKFLSPEVALYLYKSTIRPCMEYCCRVWAGAPVATGNC